nr:hypothetical protein [Clostridioides sp.]
MNSGAGTLLEEEFINSSCSILSLTLSWLYIITKASARVDLSYGQIVPSG